MKNDTMGKTILRLGGILFAVSAVIALALGLVNYVTKDIIARRQAQTLNDAMQIVLPVQGGPVTNNPVLVQLLGMCSTMAITTIPVQRHRHGPVSADHPDLLQHGISAMRKIIPNEIRIAIFVVVIAGFVTIVDLLLQAYRAGAERPRWASLFR
jgi:preprotein translocase subunit SecE